MIEQKAGEWPRHLDRLAEIGMPPNQDELSAPRPDEGMATPESLAAVTDEVIRLEQLLNETNGIVDWIGREMVDMAEAYVPDAPGDADDPVERYRRALGSGGDSEAYAEARRSAQQQLDAWTAYARTLGEVVSLWRTARAVAEHNLSWQSYLSGAA